MPMPIHMSRKEEEEIATGQSWEFETAVSSLQIHPDDYELTFSKDTAAMTSEFKKIVADNPLTKIVHSHLWANHLPYIYEMINGGEDIPIIQIELRDLAIEQIPSTVTNMLCRDLLISSLINYVDWHALAWLYWDTLRDDCHMNKATAAIFEEIRHHGITINTHTFLWQEKFNYLQTLVADACDEFSLARRIEQFVYDCVSQDLSVFNRNMIFSSIALTKWNVIAQLYWLRLRNPLA